MCSLFLVGAVNAQGICRSGVESGYVESQFNPLTERVVPVEGLGHTLEPQPVGRSLGCMTPDEPTGIEAKERGDSGNESRAFRTEQPDGDATKEASPFRQRAW